MAVPTRRYRSREVPGMPDPAGQRLSQINLTLAGYVITLTACVAGQGGPTASPDARPMAGAPSPELSEPGRRGMAGNLTSVSLRFNPGDLVRRLS